MRKLIVKASPVLPFEVFEVEDNFTNISKIYQCQWSRQVLDYLKEYTSHNKENTEVNFMGPKSYISHFVEEANKLEFVKATGTGA